MKCRRCEQEYVHDVEPSALDAGRGLCGRCRSRDAGRAEGTRSVESATGSDTKECPACAEPIRLRATICRYCGHDVRLPVPGPERSRPARARSRDARLRPGALPLVKSPALAACLSFLFSGLGQLYCGRIGRGLAILIGPTVLVLALLVGGFAFGGGLGTGTVLLLYLGALVFYVWQIFDAYQCAGQANHGLTRRARPRHTTARTRRRRGRRRAAAR